MRRIAANEPSFLSVHLRVQDQRDKQKLNIKALDVVLFGPPTRKNKSSPSPLSLLLCLLNLFAPLVCIPTNCIPGKLYKKALGGGLKGLKHFVNRKMCLTFLSYSMLPTLCVIKMTLYYPITYQALMIYTPSKNHDLPLHH